MKKWKYGIAILIVLICLVFPVSADLFNGYYKVAPNINQGATVFIGEQGLNIAPALAAANADRVPSAYTTIGWWQNTADISNTAPILIR